MELNSDSGPAAAAAEAEAEAPFLGLGLRWGMAAVEPLLSLTACSNYLDGQQSMGWCSVNK
jgi:hypothetical protein